jgi:hypothetical protein
MLTVIFCPLCHDLEPDPGERICCECLSKSEPGPVVAAFSDVGLAYAYCKSKGAGYVITAGVDFPFCVRRV